MASGRLVDYVGKGLLAARPASLTLTTGAMGLYYATDTGAITVWDGSAWQTPTISVPDETIDDRVAALLVAGTGITLTYNDVANTLTIDGTVTQYTDEMARDALGTALTAGTGITITPNDVADTITIAASGGGGSFSGAKVTKSTDLNSTNITTAAVVSWDTENYDVGGWYDAGSPTRLTVPSGITGVAITAYLGANTVAGTDFLLLYIYKNGVETGARQFVSVSAASRYTTMSFQDACVAGDYYEVYAQIQADTSVNILAAYSGFSIIGFA